MNFRTVESILGQMNNGYQASTKMFATLNAILKQFADKNGKPLCSCQITDDNGEMHQVTIKAGRNGLPQGNLIGQRCDFLLQPYQGKNGLAFSGFCNGPAVQPAQRQQLPQSPATTAKNFGAAPAKQDNNDLIVRQCCAKAAAEIVATSPTITVELFIAWANHIYDWVMNKPKQVEQPAPTQDFGDFAEDNPQTGDEVPF